MNMRVVYLLTSVQLLIQQIVFSQDYEHGDRFKAEAMAMGRRWNRERLHADSVAARTGALVRITTPRGTTIELQRYDNELPVYYGTHNLLSARTISTSLVWPGSQFAIPVAGSGQRLALWDAGLPRATHQELFSRIFVADRLMPVLGHSTHVAATMIASGARLAAKGMASAAELRVYDWNNDLAEMVAAAGAGLQVSNHSYGIVAGWLFDAFGDGRWAWFGDPAISETDDYKFGLYSSLVHDWDLVASLAPQYLIVKSAGNDRADSGAAVSDSHWVYRGRWVLETASRSRDGAGTGFDCLAGPSVGKNILTVGAIYPMGNGYSTAVDAIMAPFSSWGPTDDGRIKPDIVADGMAVFSALDSSDDAYGIMSGTSMAAPAVAGSVSLLLELRRRCGGTSAVASSTIRALLVHTADEAGPGPGPDYMFGWGVMNTARAADLVYRDACLGTGYFLREIHLTQGSYVEVPVYADGVAPLTATICWTDPPGSPSPPSLNPSMRALVNDLDLRVTDSLLVHEPWVLDPAHRSFRAATGDNDRDVVEQVRIEHPNTGRHVITITHKGQLKEGEQTVSLVVSGGVFSPPEGLVLRQPLDDTRDLTASSVTFSWSSGCAAARYEFQMADDSLFMSTMRDTVVADTALTLHGFPEDHRYYWRVRGVNGAGAGPWTAPWQFATATRGIQYVRCAAGWNMISCFVSPPDVGLDSLMILPSSLLLLKDNLGGVYWPSRGVNTIGSWDVTQGYLAYLTAGDTLRLEGALISPERTPIHLPAGWNMPSYLRSSPMQVSVALSSIAAHLVLAKDVMGNVYWPEKGIDGIGALQPGSGYLVFVRDEATLLYPPLGRAVGSNMLAAGSIAGIDKTSENKFLQPITGRTASLLVHSEQLDPGDEIRIKTSGGCVVGFGRADRGKAMAIIWGADEMLGASCSGAGEGDNLHIFSRKVIDGTESQIAVARIIDVLGGIDIQGPFLYKTNSVVEAFTSTSAGGVTSGQPGLPREHALFQNYPNPFNATTTIRYAVPGRSDVQLTVFNALGECVAILVQAEQEAGYHEVRFDGSGLASGVYFYRVQIGRFAQSRVLILLR